MITIGLIITLATALGAAVIGAASQIVLNKDDNSIERTCEDIIKAETGINTSKTKKETIKKIITRHRKHLEKLSLESPCEEEE